jgi:hypothetical protein
MALVRFTQEAAPQTGNQQNAGLGTKQGIQITSGIFRTTKGIQEANSCSVQNLEPQDRTPVVVSSRSR